MGRWSDRRAAKRARKMGTYLGDYYGQEDHGSTGTASPYQVEMPPAPGADPTRRRSRRSKRSAGKNYDFPPWVSQPGRLDPAQANRMAREQRRRSAGWPTSGQAATATGDRTGTAPSRSSRQRSGAARTKSARTSGPASGSTEPNTNRRTRRWVLGGAVGATVLIGAIVAAIGAIPRGPDVDDRDHPEFETVWNTQIENPDPHDYGSPSLVPINSLDGISGPRKMITTDAAWLIVAQREDRSLIALDPTDGSQAWRHELPEVQCSHRTGPQDTLVCLAADSPGGRDWTGYVFDAATGAEVDSWPAPISGAWTVHLTDAGLAVVAESEPNTYDHLVLLDIQDGSEIWATDLSVIDDDLLFSTREDDGVEITYLRQVEWAGQSERIMMGVGSTLILVQADSGEFTHQNCYPLVDTGEMLGCSDYRESIMYDADGAQLWSSDRVHLARHAYRGEHVLVNTFDQSVHHTDWDSGYIGAAVQSVGYSTIATGSSDHPFLMDEEELLALAPDGSQVHWSMRVRGMNSITDVWVVDDLAIVSGASTLALDLATGEEVWQRYSPGDMYLVDGQILTIGYREVSLLQMP